MSLTTSSEDLNDSIGSVTTWLDRKIVSSPESDEAAGNSSANPFETRAPSLIDEPFDETINHVEEEDWLFDPAEVKRQLEILMGGQGAGPSKQRAAKKRRAKKKRADPPGSSYLMMQL